MRRELLYWAGLAVAAGLAGVILYTTYQDAQSCAEPVRYAIGEIDPRFLLDETVARENAAAAADIWNSAAGKAVVTYDPEATLKINFIYDEREALVKLGLQIAAQQSVEKETRDALARAQDRFDAEQTAYNQKVAAINARGGATPEQLVELSRERAQLEALAVSINAQVETYNNRVAARNSIIEEYNKSAGRTYEEGQYVRDRAGERINIFVYLDNEQLTRVLAHEFGHAIGLGHNEDPNAIMYAKNESGNLTPSAADIEALEALCGA